jgi:HD-GYP domain-containing protein (c-di-GMP phosphodiesterase class II)
VGAAKKRTTASIFSQKLDRVAFTAYFLGAVVPLVALGLVIEKFVFPVVSDSYVTLGLVGLFTSIAVLSLGSFMVLRLTTRHSIDRIDSDNRRLSALLGISNSLATVEYGNFAAETAARTALALAGARASFVLTRGEAGAAPARIASAGEDAAKLEQRLVEPLVKLANLVMSEGRPALRGPEDPAPAMIAIPLPGEATPAGALVALAADGRGAFEPEEIDALTTLGGLTAVALRNADLRDAQRNFFTHVTDLLVSALDSHLGYHGGHGARVARYANRIGRQMGLDDHRLERLHFSALLHDIGMLKLNGQQQLNRRERTKHTVLGGRLLARIRLWEHLAPLVQHHHEWWDGSGYPDGLSGTAIPLESRIIAVCEAFDAITSSTSYKEAAPLEFAVHEIESGAGTQFDPDAASAFLEVVRSGAISPGDQN